MPPFTDLASLRTADVVLVRHGETTYNTKELLNGDPRQPVPLSGLGKAQCAALAPLFADVPWASLFVTRFPRTRESLELLLPALDALPEVLPDLDDINVGEFEGRSRQEYREWRHHHGVAEAPRGGESRLAVLRRYGRGLGWLAAEAAGPALVVTHDQPLRYLENALQGEDPIAGPIGSIPNAVPYPYDRATLARGADLLLRYAGDADASARSASAS
jgi:probable phosphoglycerate mutase